MFSRRALEKCTINDRSKKLVVGRWYDSTCAVEWISFSVYWKRVYVILPYVLQSRWFQGSVIGVEVRLPQGKLLLPTADTRPSHDSVTLFVTACHILPIHLSSIQECFLFSRILVLWLHQTNHHWRAVSKLMISVLEHRLLVHKHLSDSGRLRTSVWCIFFTIQLQGSHAVTKLPTLWSRLLFNWSTTAGASLNTL